MIILIVLSMRIFAEAAVIIVCLCLLVFSQSSILGAAAGFELFISCVLPSLFPFFVCVSALKRLGMFDGSSKKATGTLFRLFAVSCISGSPSGSVLVNTVFANMTPERRGVFSACLNLSGPVFIAGTVATGMLNLPKAAPLIAAAHYGSSLLMLTVFSIFNKCTAADGGIAGFSKRNRVSEVLPESIGDATALIFRVGGALIFFMTLIGIIDGIPFIRRSSPVVKGVLFGSIEMTNGIKLISGVGISLRSKLSLITALLSFGGICVFIQACGTGKFAVIPYLATKFFHALIAGAICFALYPLFDNGSPVGSNTSQLLLAERAFNLITLLFSSFITAAISSLAAIFFVRRTRA